MTKFPYNIAETVTLNNGVRMPWLGLGVFMANDPAELDNAIRAALHTGYRSIDTADIYGNEKAVGTAIRSSGMPRDSLFITTKLWNARQAEGYEASLKACDVSLQKLGLDFVDLYLIHWPIEGKSVAAWKALIKLLDQGKTRSIGVSNFSEAQIEELIAATGVIPAVNQIELHPWRSQRPLLSYCQAKGIQVEAYCPLMRGRFSEEPVIGEIARRCNRTPAQILLRWSLQNNVVVIPKSVHAERIAENAVIFSFELDQQDMAALNALNRDQTVLPPPPKNL